jgi:hypothetical protein
MRGLFWMGAARGSRREAAARLGPSRHGPEMRVKHEASLASNLVHFAAFAVGLLLILAIRYAFEV